MDELNRVQLHSLLSFLGFAHIRPAFASVDLKENLENDAFALKFRQKTDWLVLFE